MKRPKNAYVLASRPSTRLFTLRALGFGSSFPLFGNDLFDPHIVYLQQEFSCWKSGANEQAGHVVAIGAKPRMGNSTCFHSGPAVKPF